MRSRRPSPSSAVCPGALAQLEVFNPDMQVKRVASLESTAYSRVTSRLEALVLVRCSRPTVALDPQEAPAILTCKALWVLSYSYRERKEPSRSPA